MPKLDALIVDVQVVPQASSEREDELIRPRLAGPHDVLPDQRTIRGDEDAVGRVDTQGPHAALAYAHDRTQRDRRAGERVALICSLTFRSVA